MWHPQNHAYYAGIMLDALHTYYAKNYTGIIDSGLYIHLESVLNL